MAESRRLLAVLAHADDETLVIGGALARYAAEGVEVHLVIATVDVGAAAFTRAAELERATEELGLADFRFLGYKPTPMTWRPPEPAPDGGDYLVTSPVESVAERVANEIRRMKPQVVVTFDSTGGYGHPDHIAIGRATQQAFEKVVQDRGNDVPQRLYAAVFGRGLLRWGVHGMRIMPSMDPRRYGPNGDIDLVAALEEAPRPTTWVDVRQYLDIRRRAVVQHQSGLATGPWVLRRYELLPSSLRGAMFHHEVFSRLWPEPLSDERETSLFAGLP